MSTTLGLEVTCTMFKSFDLVIGELTESEVYGSYKEDDEECNLHVGDYPRKSKLGNSITM